MRNKTYGLSRLEISKLQSSKPLSLDKTIEILNSTDRTRFQTEQAIKSIKYHACQHILNAEINRPTVSHAQRNEFINLVIGASQRLGLDIYKEYKMEYLQKTGVVKTTNEPQMVVYPQLGTQHQYAHMNY